MTLERDKSLFLYAPIRVLLVNTERERNAAAKHAAQEDTLKMVTDIKADQPANHASPVGTVTLRQQLIV